MANYLITGATSGLGQQVAIRLARSGGHHLTLPVRDTAKGEKLRAELLALGAAKVDTPLLDLASLASVSDFVARLQRDTNHRLDGVLFNAGRQSASELVKTVDGIESTFAVNHLAHYVIFKGLVNRLSPRAIVGWTASGTHDPAEKSAKLAGFRGSRYATAARLAEGDYDDASGEQACRDAYATSKLCNIVTARAFADEADTGRTYFSFDPGLMPGTGLAREQSAAMYWVWKNILPRVANLLPGTSSTERSSAVLLDLLTGKLRGSHNGAYFNYTGRQLEPAGAAKEQWVAQDLLEGSDRILAKVEKQRHDATSAAVS